MLLNGFVAKELGCNPRKVKYDCRKVQVSLDVKECIYLWYHESNNVGEKDMNMIWLNYGPKVFLGKRRHKSYYIEVEDNFIIN